MFTIRWKSNLHFLIIVMRHVMPWDPWDHGNFRFFYSINRCSNTWMNNWRLFLWMSYPFPQFHYPFTPWGISAHKSNKYIGIKVFQYLPISFGFFIEFNMCIVLALFIACTLALLKKITTRGCEDSILWLQSLTCIYIYFYQLHDHWRYYRWPSQTYMNPFCLLLLPHIFNLLRQDLGIT